MESLEKTPNISIHWYFSKSPPFLVNIANLCIYVPGHILGLFNTELFLISHCLHISPSCLSGGAFTTLNGGSVRGSEASGSNPSDHWAEVNGKPFGSSAAQHPPDGTPTSSGSTQPLLRRNQYWVRVWTRYYCLLLAGLVNFACSQPKRHCYIHRTGHYVKILFLEIPKTPIFGCEIQTSFVLL